MINKKKIGLKVFGLIFIGLIIFITIEPSNNRNWATDQKILSYSEFNKNIVNVYNIRNFTYTTTSDYEISYYNKSFDLNELDSVYYIVEPFSEWEGSAHTFVSFGFSNGEYISISVEIRKEQGESFSAIKGLFKQYELMYVVGDERDLIKLRTNYRKDSVYLYPINTTPEKMREMFFEMFNRTNKLKKTPEFYNTLTSSCTTNLVSHINTISPKRVPFSLKILLPGYSDQLAYDLNLIKKKGTFEETREYYKINKLALKFGDNVNFSKLIRPYENE